MVPIREAVSSCANGPPNIERKKYVLSTQPQLKANPRLAHRAEPIDLVHGHGSSTSGGGTDSKEYQIFKRFDRFSVAELVDKIKTNLVLPLRPVDINDFGTSINTIC